MILIVASVCNVHCGYVILYFQNSVGKKQEDDSSGVVSPGYITLIPVKYRINLFTNDDSYVVFP